MLIKRFPPKKIITAIAMAAASAFTVSANAVLTMTSVLNSLSCTAIPSPIPQGAPGQGGSILANAFGVYGRLTQTAIPNIAGHAARRFDYQYVVQNASIPTGRLTHASNGSQTTYTGKVQVDAYNFPWKPAYYTAFKVVSDPISSMQLDEPFYAQQIIGGGIVEATYLGPAWTVVVKGALSNGEMRNVAICTLPPTVTTIY
jgi:hypothetical protein